MLTHYDVNWEDTTNLGHPRIAHVVLEDGYTEFEDIRKIIAIKNTDGDIKRVRVCTTRRIGVQE